MINRLLRRLRSLYRYYNLAAGVILLITVICVGILYVRGQLKPEKFGPAFTYVTSEKEHIVKKETVKIPEGEWIEEKRKSHRAIRNKLKKKEERLNKRQSTLNSKRAELNRREEELDQREQELEKRKKAFQESKSKWEEEISDRNVQRIVQAIQTRANERGNPQQALQMLNQFVSVNKKEGQPNYQLAYRILNALPQENRTTLLYALNRGNYPTLRDEMYKRFAPLDQQQTE